MVGVTHDGATRVPIQQPVLLSGTVAAGPLENHGAGGRRSVVQCRWATLEGAQR